MAVNKEQIIGSSIAVLVVIFIVLFTFALYKAGQKDDAHNRQQLAECRSLGGFAKTSVNGWLESCTFPGGS